MKHGLKSENVTEAIKSRADAHPLKSHDHVIRVDHPTGDSHHVKVRLTHHPLSLPSKPLFMMTGSITDETGKTKLNRYGAPLVNETSHQIEFLGFDPGEGVTEFDVEGWVEEERHSVARRVSRASLAFDKISSMAGPVIAGVSIAPGISMPSSAAKSFNEAHGPRDAATPSTPLSSPETKP